MQGKHMLAPVPYWLRPAAYRLWRELAVRRGIWDVSDAAFVVSINDPDGGGQRTRVYNEFWALWIASTNSGTQAPPERDGPLRLVAGGGSRVERERLQRLRAFEEAEGTRARRDRTRLFRTIQVLTGRLV